MSKKPRKTPIWRAISDTLRTDISEGRYIPGMKLPTEAALSERFGVNRHTVRHALSALVDDGLVRTRRGSGAYVSSRSVKKFSGEHARSLESLVPTWDASDLIVLNTETRAVTEGEAEALWMARGDKACVFRGLVVSDSETIALFESLLPTDRLPGIAAALTDHGHVKGAFEALGVDKVHRASTHVTAMRASSTEALHLQIQEGDPLLKSTGVNVDADGDPVELQRVWFVGDRVTLRMES
ncbi:MAG: phosphonate metabolism transcriptional regulator PhnF [Pseudomonadota bacterium]